MPLIGVDLKDITAVTMFSSKFMEMAKMALQMWKNSRAKGAGGKDRNVSTSYLTSCIKYKPTVIFVKQLDAMKPIYIVYT